MKQKGKQQIRIYRKQEKADMQNEKIEIIRPGI